MLFRRARGSGRTLSVILVLVGLLVAPFATLHVERAAATHTTIKLPFLGTGAWYAWEGYNYPPLENGTHWDCDASTGFDEPSQTIPCRPLYVYKYSFDLRRVDEQTAFQPVLAPADGTICWIDRLGFGGMAIDFGDGLVFAYFHTRIAGGIAPGQFVSRGQFLGVVAPPGEAGNGGIAHVHINLWRSWTCGGSDRDSEPFTGDHKLDGYDFPALSDSVLNQHVNAQMTSTNIVSGATKPTTPVLFGPTEGSTTNTATPLLSWDVSTRAIEYQVSIDGGAVVSPWIEGRSWRPPDLPPGEHTWRVRGRNPLSTGSFSSTKRFIVPAGVSRVQIDPGQGMVNTNLSVQLSGFGANERVTLAWDVTSASLKSVTVNGSGTATTTLRVPRTIMGSHTLLAIGATTGRIASVPFLVNRARVIAEPDSGKVGTRVDVRAYGFGEEEPVFIAWDGFITDFGDSSADGDGNFRASTVAPELPAGRHTIELIGEVSDQRGADTFTIVPSLAIGPSSGSPSTRITVRGKGWPASSPVSISWTRTSGGSTSTVCSTTSNELGTWVCRFNAPAGEAGDYRIRARSGSYSNSRTFSLTASLAAVPTEAAASPTPTATASATPSASEMPTVIVTEEATPTATMTPEVNAEPTVDATQPPEPTAELTENPTESPG